jgi:MoaA/NifB/PqqE/SkfB family radical SAM enzyme
MAKKTRNNTVTIRLSDDELELITKIANEFDIDKSRLMRNIIIGEIDSTTMYITRKSGLMKGILNFADILDKEHKDILKYETNEDYEKATGKKIEKKWTDWLLK